jgi:hypothetical protein
MPTEMDVSPSSHKSQKKILEDDTIFEVGKDWAADAKDSVEDSATIWPQVSQIVRTYVPFAYNAGPQWHACDILN